LLLSRHPSWIKSLEDNPSYLEKCLNYGPKELQHLQFLSDEISRGLLGSSLHPFGPLVWDRVAFSAKHPAFKSWLRRQQRVWREQRREELQWQRQQQQEEEKEEEFEENLSVRARLGFRDPSDTSRSSMSRSSMSDESESSRYRQARILSGAQEQEGVEGSGMSSN
jgi:hypothetical protein